MGKSLHWGEGRAFLGAGAFVVVLAEAGFWEGLDAHGRFAAVAVLGDALGSGRWGALALGEGAVLEAGRGVSGG